MRAAVVLACLLLPSSLVAQSGGGGITVSGTVDLSKSPDVLRLYVKQYARGDDQDTAKSSLIAAEQRLLTKLGEAGAEVVLSTPGTIQPSSNLQGRYANVFNMLNRRVANNFNGVIVNNPPEKASIFLERYVSVDLRPRDRKQDILALTGKLQEKLRTEYHDLSGLNGVFPKDDPNDPLNKAVQAQIHAYRNDSSYYAQDVQLYLAAKITREDRRKLYALAMKKARSIADDLAEAASVRLGGLHGINANFYTSTANVPVMGSGRYAAPEHMRFPFFKDDPGLEAVTARQIPQNYSGQPSLGNLEPLTYQLTLTVTYTIENKR